MTDFHADVLPLRQKIFRLALRITGQREEAEDIVQETLLRVWQKLSSGSEIESAQAFTLTTARHLALDAVRRSAGEVEPLDEEAGRVASAVPATSHHAEHQDHRQWLRRIVAAMPERQRTMLGLRDVERMSYKDIAATLGVSEDTVKVTIYRARQRIRQEYEQIERYGL